MLTVNNLREFRPIVHAIRTGNLGLMEDALAKYEFFFVRTGIYLLGMFRFHKISILNSKFSGKVEANCDPTTFQKRSKNGWQSSASVAAVSRRAALCRND